MSAHPPHAAAPPARGLQIERGAASGPVIAPTPDGHAAALARHERVLRELDAVVAKGTTQPGCWLLLSLVCDSMVLHPRTITLATGPSALTYRCRGEACVELNSAHGWRDRIVLSTRTLALAHANQGMRVSRADRARALRLYRQWFPEIKAPAWSCLLADAATWWHERTPRNEFDHVMRIRPLQPLPRVALARLVTMLPAAAPVARQGPEPAPDAMTRFPEPDPGPPCAEDEAHIAFLLTTISAIARDKGERKNARVRIVAAADRALAAVRGADAFHTVMGLRSVVVEGGLAGRLLAPRTLANYVSATLIRLYRALAWMKPLYHSAAAMRATYEQLIGAAAKSMKTAVGAFLGAFHRYLVVLGAEPLLEPLSHGAPARAPRARVIWRHELDLALQYIDARAPHPQVRLQARLMLLLGHLVPMRPAEYWCIRLHHVPGDDRLSLHVYTEISDGGPKASFTTRPIDIDDREVAGALLELREYRSAQGAGDGERLMGHSDSADGRFQCRATETLVKSALVWASGEPDAGPYDLRHSAISRKESELAAPASVSRVGTDHVPNFVLTAYSGHARRSSAECYIHQFEERIAHTCRQARSAAWGPSEAGATALAALPGVEDGLVCDRPPMPAGTTPSPVARSADLTPDQRRKVMDDVLDERPLDEIARRHFTEVTAVQEAMGDLVEAATYAGVLPMDSYITDAERGVALGLIKTWRAEATTPKWAGLSAQLDAMQAAGQWLDLERLQRDWCCCVRGVSLSIESGAATARLITFLRDRCGIESQRMLLLQQRKAPPPHPRVVALALEQRLVPKRKGRRPYRLVVSPPGVRASKAPDRVLSMLGLHWRLLLLGAALEAQRSL